MAFVFTLLSSKLSPTELMKEIGEENKAGRALILIRAGFEMHS